MSTATAEYADVIEAIAERVEKLGDGFPPWQNCFQAALEQTRDPHKALALADQAVQHMPRVVAMSAADLAERIEAAAAETDTEPTEGQKKAGTYRKGRVSVHGLPITIENPQGSTRSGVSPDGTTWSNTMAAHYGYVRGTESEMDSDHVDVFIGPDHDCTDVYIIDQCNEAGDFDEHKCMLCFADEDAARAGYLACYSPGWKCGPITCLDMDTFKAWLEDGYTDRPIAEQFPGSEMEPNGCAGWTVDELKAASKDYSLFPDGAP